MKLPSPKAWAFMAGSMFTAACMAMRREEPEFALILTMLMLAGLWLSREPSQATKEEPADDDFP